MRGVLDAALVVAHLELRMMVFPMRHPGERVAERLDPRGRQAGEGGSLHQLLPDHGFRQRARLGVASGRPSSGAPGELPPAECQAEVWVLREADAQRAEAILLGIGGRAGGPHWKCLSCGETSEPQFTQCWRCGNYRET